MFKSEESHLKKLWASLQRREKQALRATNYISVLFYLHKSTLSDVLDKKSFFLKIGSDKIAAKEQIRSKSHQTSLTQKRGKAKKAFTN